MMFYFDLSIIVFAALLQIPFVVFWLECWLAFLPYKRSTVDCLSDVGEVWVIVPAHNEAAVIGATLANLTQTLRKNERVLVVADNCQDHTAQIAREAGSLAIERHDPSARGKGHALQFAFEYLERHHTPSIVVILDADCRVSPQTVTRISMRAFEGRRPVQALNLSEARRGSDSLHVLSELGFRFKNLVRPLGFRNVGLPCHLMGTGMAIPWQLLQNCRVAGDSLAEDMQWGIELALLGHAARFHAEDPVLSELPHQAANFMTQRTRWEQGHLRTAFSQIPKLLKRGVLRGRIDLVALALDLLIPPFSLLMAIWAFACFCYFGFWLAGASFWPCLLLCFTGAFTALTILCCWWKFCRVQIPFRAILTLPFYVGRKLPIYASFLLGRGAKQWIRTQREPAASPEVVEPQLTNHSLH